MIKRVLLLSSLMLSAPAWATAAATPGADATTPAATAPAAADSAGLSGEMGFRSPTPNTGNPEKDALIIERHQRQRMVYHLQAKRDSEVNRMALGRLAAARGGDPDFSPQKNARMLEQIREARAEFDRQIEVARAALQETSLRLAALEAREQAGTQARTASAE